MLPCRYCGRYPASSLRGRLAPSIGFALARHLPSGLLDIWPSSGTLVFWACGDGRSSWSTCNLRGAGVVVGSQFPNTTMLWANLCWEVCCTGCDCGCWYCGAAQRTCPERYTVAHMVMQGGRPVLRLWFHGGTCRDHGCGRRRQAAAGLAYTARLLRERIQRCLTAHMCECLMFPLAPAEFSWFPLAPLRRRRSYLAATHGIPRCGAGVRPACDLNASTVACLIELRCGALVTSGCHSCARSLARLSGHCLLVCFSPYFSLIENPIR